MGATDKGRAAAPAAILNERTPSKTSSTREIVCLTCYYFCQLWGSQSNIGSQDPNSRRNVSVDVVLRSFVAPQLANCRYTKSPDSFVKIPKKVVRCRL